MAFTALTNEETEVGKPVKKSLWRKVKDNFDDHETRINSVETFGNLIEIFDISPKDLGKDVGKVVSSRLTEAQFQEVNGDNWVLCDGRSAAGTYFNTITGLSNIPDYQNAFLRGNPSSGRVLGSSQTEAIPDHTHTVNFTDYSNANPGSTNTDEARGWSAAIATNSEFLDHTYDGNELSSSAYSLAGLDWTTDYGGGVSNDLFLDIKKAISVDIFRYPDRVSRAAIEYPTSIANVYDTASIISAGANSGTGSEVRPTNQSVNYFVKIDRDNLTKYQVYKVKQNITLTDVKVEVIHQDGYSAPTAGTLEIDLRTGSTLASLSSIFNTKPNVTTFAEGDNSGVPDIITGREDVDAGQYIVLDITSLQQGQSQIYITVLAEPR